jgi:hypothetical protein
VKPTAASEQYCIDTSSLVNLHQWRPAVRFPKAWRRLATLMQTDRLIAPRAVLEELARREDTLLTWARRRKSMFKKTTPSLVRRVREIIRRFPDLADINAASGSADPFVVALALEKSTLLGKAIVVTEEKYAPGRTRIPHVCQAYDLRYLTVHQLFLFEGWPFDE